MRVLLTGGYGCIGSWIVKGLLDRGAEVRVFDLREDPRRLIEPERYEPLFEIARNRGYEWNAANAVGPTERAAPGETAPLSHIDWFLVRGLHVSEPAIIPAVDERGRMISDHEMIMVTIAA